MTNFIRQKMGAWLLRNWYGTILRNHLCVIVVVFSTCRFISVKLHIFLALFIYVVADVAPWATGREEGTTGEEHKERQDHQYYHYYLIQTITFCPHKLVLA